MPEIYTPEKMNPHRPAELLAWLGSPQERWPAIHIAGTKGKGSIAAFCAYALRQAGLKVGLYTSPHLLDFRERIRILTLEDSQGLIPHEQLVAGVEQLKRAVVQVDGLTWFELVTALAFWHFAQQKVDVAVVEVGLGGRLDATNVLVPLAAVIASISYDHMDLLGQSLTEIAGEKGGIIKRNVPAIIAPQPAEARSQLQTIAQNQQAPTIWIGEDVCWQEEQPPTAAGQHLLLHHLTNPVSQIHNLQLTVPLLGKHQQENGVTAAATLDVVSNHFPTLNRQAIQQGMAATKWRGRLEKLGDRPTVVVDCAHNGDSAEKLAEAVGHFFQYERLFLLLGVTQDKDIAGILRPLLPLARHTIVSQSSHPRAAAAEIVQNAAASLGYSVQTAELVPAFSTLCQLASPNDLICVTGSIFIVSDLIQQFYL